ncbi:XRE family transcriptional regulator [Streptomyces sp. LZ34]
MRPPTPDQLRLRAELAQVRARLLVHLSSTVGPALSEDAAQAALEEAKAWKGPNAFRLAAHLDSCPRALASPSPHCPRPLVRLAHLLVEAGYGDVVAKVACADCRRTDPLPSQDTPEGRVCSSCYHRRRRRACARCGLVRAMYARRPEGAICEPCHRRETSVKLPCPGCGRLALLEHRAADGEKVCWTCAPTPTRRCTGCGRQRRVNAVTPQGPVCGSCYTSPPRTCGICGIVGPISVKAAGGRPDICQHCYQHPRKECSVCGRIRAGNHIDRGRGAFHCDTCIPRPLRDCGICGRQRPVKIFWPLGPVCSACYRRRRASPSPCAGCSATRILVGITDDGESGLCATCCAQGGTPGGVVGACAACHVSADLRPDGRCPGCSLRHKVHDLLTDSSGNVPAGLAPLEAVLTDVTNHYPVLEWIRRSPAARLLARLAQSPDALTHHALDTLPPDANTAYVRGLLVMASVLPPRHENLARLETWLAAKLAQLPPHHVTLVRPFAEWGIVKDARRRAARGRYSLAAYKGDCTDIRVTIKFLTWLDTQKLHLRDLTQAHLDEWASTHPTQRSRLIPFVRWVHARRIVRDLEIQHRPTQLPGTFQDETTHQAELRRCLTDTGLPLPMRIIGALVRLYALPLTRIVELTTDQFHRDAETAYLTLDRHPVLLPPALATLLDEQIAQLHASQPPQGHRRLLLPGAVPGRPRNPAGLADQMKHHGLPVRAARNTALMEAITDLPPIVVADLFGISPATAHRWSQLAGNSWAPYLAARQRSRP